MVTYASQQASHEDKTLILPTRGLGIKLKDVYALFLLFITIFLNQVRLMTEVLHTPSSTQPGFELMTSRS